MLTEVKNWVCNYCKKEFHARRHTAGNVYCSMNCFVKSKFSKNFNHSRLSSSGDGDKK